MGRPFCWDVRLYGSGNRYRLSEVHITSIFSVEVYPSRIYTVLLERRAEPQLPVWEPESYIIVVYLDPFDLKILYILCKPWSVLHQYLVAEILMWFLTQGLFMWLHSCLQSEHFAWQQAVHWLSLFQFVMSGGPCSLVQCISVIVGLSLTYLKKML
jgi:hypothetical protein